MVSDTGLCIHRDAEMPPSLAHVSNRRRKTISGISIVINPPPCSRSVDLTVTITRPCKQELDHEQLERLPEVYPPSVFHNRANSKPTESSGENYQWCIHCEYVPVMSELNQSRVTRKRVNNGCSATASTQPC